jgi:hypothetical protein
MSSDLDLILEEMIQESPRLLTILELMGRSRTVAPRPHLVPPPAAAGAEVSLPKPGERAAQHPWSAAGGW